MTSIFIVITSIVGGLLDMWIITSLIKYFYNYSVPDHINIIGIIIVSFFYLGTLSMMVAKK